MDNKKVHTEYPTETDNPDIELPVKANQNDFYED